MVSRADTGLLRLQAMDIVLHHTMLAAGASVIPLWWASSPSITGVQLNMLSRLSRLYDTEFADDFAKPLIASLGGGFLSLLVSQNPFSLALKGVVVAIPVVGIPLRFGTGPAIMATYTYLLGKAFIKHYESGGSYLDFHLGKLKEELYDAVGFGPLPVMTGEHRA